MDHESVNMRTPRTDAITPEQAKVDGFIVDDTCYPWVAYKGLRFAPTEIRECYTDLEARLMNMLGDDCHTVAKPVKR